MNKATKGNKSKVHKLTEEEYAAYISALKTDGQLPLQVPMSAMNTNSELKKEQKD